MVLQLRLFDVAFIWATEKQSTGLSPVLVSSSGRHQGGGLGRQPSQSCHAEAVSLKNGGLNESGSTSSGAVHVNNISQRMEKDTSKWQLKGKRNSRHISKNRKQDRRKYMVMDMDNEPAPYLAGIEHSDGFFPVSDQRVDCDGSRRSLASFNCKVDGVRDWSKSFSHRDMRGAIGDVSLPPQRSLPYRQSRFTVNSRYQTSDFPGRTITDSKLYDVKLEVKANYQPQNVPLVSLMSKLNGKAIIGRPLTVECVDDGFCDLIIRSNECDPTRASALDAAELGHAAMRNSDAGRIPAKHMTMQARFSPSKSPKRKCVLLPKKIRKLSTLTGNKEEYRKPVVEKLKGPVIACIPLKLVFSRINEAVNGSARQTNRALTSSNS
ncbi:uncharacterized protein At1g51745 [Jatropha curcas]|uniref:uncharacterized protein At1g51745 n=1 Tax=Jatropha curcas TaxID=180498 RepID=UPI0018963949|nr:uncharacterized protein At1g51745 [Jatropha curcas]